MMMGIMSRVGAFDAFFLFDDTMCDFFTPAVLVFQGSCGISSPWEVWDEGFDC